MIVTFLSGCGVYKYVRIYKNEQLVDADYHAVDDDEYPINDDDVYKFGGRRELFHPDQKMWGNGTEAPFSLPEREPGPKT